MSDSREVLSTLAFALMVKSLGWVSTPGQNRRPVNDGRYSVRLLTVPGGGEVPRKSV